MTNQDNRKREIAKLEARCAKAEAVMTEMQIHMDQHRDNQVNRLAELRCQKLMLHFAERAEAKAAKA